MRIPALANGVRFRRTPNGQGVLLIPEGIVNLNDSAAAIVELIDGERSTAAISYELRARFAADPNVLTEDVEALVERLKAAHWLEAQDDVR